MSFPAHIFKAYDIRGLADTELSTDLAYDLGRAFVVLLQRRGVDRQGKKIVVGWDMRPTSIDYAQALVRGIQDEGLAVVTIGLASTPLFNFTCAHYPEHAGGIMVTASHNPAQFNGFKLTYNTGLPVGKDTGMNELRDLVEKKEWSEKKNAVVEEFSPLADYLTRVFRLVDKKRIQPKKIVIDAGNGMAKVTFLELIKDLPLEVEYLFLEPDGRFPNHEANPLKTETLQALQKKVVETGADFGFALDGDADRIGLVDEKGQVVPASFVGGLVGLEILKKNPGSLLWYDLRLSRAVVEKWEAMGAKTGMTPVGHANIKKIMKEKGGQFAAELSLHLYYHDMYDLESPELSLLFFLELLSQSDKPLSALWSELDQYANPGEINFEVENKERVLQVLKEKYHDAVINDLDGLLFTYPDFWFNVRLSNTEPLLRLNLEAQTREIMQKKLQEISQIIKENG
ncbi:MAG TPA: phosphomannomutase/phosphoglucomutase [Patescibacteria group bacterium]|nr:phosphomannomutase/phosphoglucomutase [Patescibacteria group bacterium]